MSDITDVYPRLGELMGILGVIDAAIQQTDKYSDEVKESWEERLDGIIAWAEQQQQEAIMFAEGWDQ